MEEFVFTNMYGCTTGSICGEAREAKLRPQKNKALQSFACTQNPCSTIYSLPTNLHTVNELTL